MSAMSSSTSSYTPAARPRPREVAARIGLAARRYPIIQVLVLVLLCAYAYHTIPGIGTRNSIYANLVLASFLGLVALGQTLVILMGGIDFSVAGFVLLGSTVTCELGGGAHWPLPAVVAVVAGLGAVGGAVSGQSPTSGRRNHSS